MTPWRRAFQFFIAVPPVPRLMVQAFVATTVAAAIAICMDAALAPAAAIPLFVLQAFATSSGFAVHARRGYYDVLLTGGVGRLRTATMHWLMSAAPGVVSWAALAAVEIMVLHSGHTLAAGTIAVLCAVSTIPWAATVALPRFTGALAWLMVSVWLLLASGDIRAAGAAGAAGTVASGTSTGRAFRAAASTVLPITVVGAPPTSTGGATIAWVSVAAASMGAAMLWIGRAPFPLEAGQ